MRDLWSLFETFPLSDLDDPRKTEVSVRALEAKNDHHLQERYSITSKRPTRFRNALVVSTVRV